MMHNYARLVAACVAVAALVLPARATVFTIGADRGDYEALETYDDANPGGDGVGDSTSNGASGALRVGSRTVNATTGFGTAAAAILPFELPAIPAGEVITGATLTVLSKPQTSNLPVANLDLYGLPLDAAPLDADPARYFAGASDAASGVVLLQDNYLVPADAEAEEHHISVDISAYIQSLYSAGAVAGDFAILRLSYDQMPVLQVHNRYLVWSRQATGTTDNSPGRWPYLEITTIPEPGSLALLSLAGAGLLARRRR